MQPAKAAPPRRSPPAVLVSGDGTAQRPQPRLLVWRQLTPAEAAPPQRPLPAGVVSGVHEGQRPESTEVASSDHDEQRPESCQVTRRRRRRPRRRQRPNQGLDGSPPAAGRLLEVVSTATPDAALEATRPLPCIIDWSDRIARAEEDLAHAVIVTVIRSNPLARADEVAAVIASRLELEAASLVLCRASASSYLLVFPNTALVESLLGLRQPLRSQGFSLLCQRWTRQAGAAGRVLPCLVDLELFGIPAHIWETSTVEQFLSPHAWIQQVHPDTVNLVDLYPF
jgi:hypothetical protein